MKNKAIILTAVTILLFSVVSASASNDHSNQRATLGESNEQEHKDEGKQTVSTSAGDINCDDGVKNHGDFVSCVAHQHLGGDSVSEAAHSDIGKKDDENEDNDSDDVSPTITPIVSVTPTVTPTATETPTVTPTVTVTSEPEQQGLLDTQIKGLIDQLKDLINSLTSLLH